VGITWADPVLEMPVTLMDIPENTELLISLVGVKNPAFSG